MRLLYPVPEMPKRLGSCWTITASVCAILSIVISLALVIVSYFVHELVEKYGLPEWWAPCVYVAAGILLLMIISQLGSVFWGCCGDTSTLGWKVYFMATACTQALYGLALNIFLGKLGSVIGNNDPIITFVVLVELVNLVGVALNLIQTILLVVHFFTDKRYDYLPLDNYALRHSGLYLP